LLKSVRATAGIPSSATFFANGLIRTKPSTSENSEWSLRWTNAGALHIELGIALDKALEGAVTGESK